jgi:hypothetical protein
MALQFTIPEVTSLSIISIKSMHFNSLVLGNLDFYEFAGPHPHSTHREINNLVIDMLLDN